jgi:hypothetical protein
MRWATFGGCDLHLGDQESGDLKESRCDVGKIDESD